VRVALTKGKTVMTPTEMATIAAASALVDAASPFTDVASASTVDLGAVESDLVRITGTTGPVTSFGTSPAGTRKVCRVATGGFLIQQSAAIICAANNSTSVLTAANDHFLVISLGSGNWIVAGYWPSELITLIDETSHAPSAGPRSFAVGNHVDTDYPDFKVDMGTSRALTKAQSFMAMTAGDTVDYAMVSVGGTQESPMNWTGFTPHGTTYSWSPQVAQTRPVDSATYIGRHWQFYGGQAQTPADGELGGWWSIGGTKLDETVPWLNIFSSASGMGRGIVFPGRSNVPGEEARVSDGGALITAPYAYSLYKNIFSAGIVNPEDTAAQGNIHLIASDGSVDFAAIAIRFSDALTYGFDITTNHADDSLIIATRAAGTRTDRIKIENDGDINPVSDAGVDLGDPGHRFFKIYGVELYAGSGQLVADQGGGLAFRAYTAAQISSAAHNVNVANKYVGKAVWDSTNRRIMVANGASAASDWYPADGGTPVTPS
jgi:hypothetical protein